MQTIIKRLARFQARVLYNNGTTKTFEPDGLIEEQDIERIKKDLDFESTQAGFDQTKDVTLLQVARGVFCQAAMRRERGWKLIEIYDREAGEVMLTSTDLLLAKINTLEELLRKK